MEHRDIDKPFFPIVFLLFCALLLISIPCANAREVSRLTIGFTGSAFQDVSNTDIKAGVSVLIQKAAFKYFDRGESHFYERLADMAADLKRGTTQVLAAPVEEFMALRKLAPIDPVLITSSSGGTEMELLLLVRKDSGIRSLRDLRGHSLATPPHNPRCRSIYQVWMEYMLESQGLGDMKNFFSSTKEAKTVAKALMQVFFRQADACLVSRQVLDLTAELNPQIKNELMVVASKGKMGEGIIAVDRRLPEETREKIRQAFLTLHQTPDGEQLLMLFKVRKLVPIPAGYLKETEALYGKHPKRAAMTYD